MTDRTALTVSATCFAALLLARPVLAQPVSTPPPAAADAAQCDGFARVYQYAQQSKRLCEEGRQVKPGPISVQVLARCRALQGRRFDQVSVGDMMDRLVQQIQRQGMGNACQAASLEAWNLISQ